MRMTRVPRNDEVDRPAAPAAVERLAPKVTRVAHSQMEERAAYLLAVCLLLSFVLSIVSLTRLDWKVDESTGEGFGLRAVQLRGQDEHYLETVGLVWACYTSARCALAFTILGIFHCAYALRAVYAFVASSKGTFRSLLLQSTAASTWLLWAIMLYATLFPRMPFQGDIFFAALGSNFTRWDSLAAAGNDRFAPFEFAALSSYPLPLPSPRTLDETIPSFPGTGTGGVPSFPPPPGTTPATPVASSSSSSTGAASSGSGGDGTGTGVATTLPPSTPAPSDDDLDPALRSQIYFGRTKFDHLASVWTLGPGYAFAVAAAVCAVGPVVLYAAFVAGQWAWAFHNDHVEAVDRRLIPPVVLLVCAWVLSMVALGSPEWKKGEGIGSFGLEFVHPPSGGSRTSLFTSSPFPAVHDAMYGASSVALGFGVVGVLLGSVAVFLALKMLYASSSERPEALLLSCTSTALVFLIALLSYGLGMPSYVPTAGGEVYVEFGWGYWTLLVAAAVYTLPLVGLLGWVILERARKTSREERLMSLPLALSLLSAVSTVAALGDERWATAPDAYGAHDHLGLVRGRIAGARVEITDIAETYPRLGAAGVASMVLLVCASSIQLPVVVLASSFVLGRHHVCAGQSALLNTALSSATCVLQILAVVAYAYLIPLGDLPAGYGLSHSWRVQIAGAIWSFAATIAFGYLSEPPLPGETNLLAEAIK